MIDKQQEINRKQLEARAKLIALSSQNYKTRLMNIYGSKTSSGINTHYIKMPTVNNVLVRDMVNTPTEDVLQTYYHEVGGHGTDSFFGTTKTYDNTGLTDKFIKPINNKNQFLKFSGE